ncbi:MAG: hypothetical protein IJY11_01950 [Clostridia bacterium]|nr:hypothetical protein [Clostridia bacterium]
MKERHYGLDLYRILCMFLITTIHIDYVDMISFTPYTHFNFYLVSLIKTLQTFSISGFVLISAYFLIEKKTSAKSSIKRIVSFEIQMVFYSIVIMLLSLLFISPNLTGWDIFKTFCPLLSNHYWYPVAYLCLLFLSPFLNKLIYVLNKKQLKILVCGIFVVFSLFSLDISFISAVYVGHETHSILLFVALYFIVAYIKLYGVNNKKTLATIAFIVSGYVCFVCICMMATYLACVANRRLRI